MTPRDVVRAWGHILNGKLPSLSIELTRECPLHCPGCYAYNDAHLGGSVTLRDLADRRGDDLVRGVLEVVERYRPMHVSLVGGDPLVRYRELKTIVPALLARNLYVQIVTSAFRELPTEWINLPRLNVVVSIDGLQQEHDARRAPATYSRILRNIAGHPVTVHCTVTAQMMQSPAYLRRFLQFWCPRGEVRKVWFSLFTPQKGEANAEVLSAEQRARAIGELAELRKEFVKMEMPDGLIRQLASPPPRPEKCIFARTTVTLSADLVTKISPCQFGGNPDCANCGCVASAALGAVAAHRLAGFIPVGTIFRASLRVGAARSRLKYAACKRTRIASPTQ